MRTLLPSHPHDPFPPHRAQLAAALCYLPGGVVAGLMLAAARHNEDVRFHAVQSLLFSGVVIALLAVLTTTPWTPLLSLVAYAVTVFVWLVALAGWLTLMVAASRGKRVRLPVLGRIAERAAGAR